MGVDFPPPAPCLPNANPSGVVSVNPRLGTAIQKASRVFDNTGKVAQSNICNTIKDKVTAFRPKVPAIVALRNPGMKPRHWEQLSEKVKKKAQPTAITICRAFASKITAFEFFLR